MRPIGRRRPHTANADDRCDLCYRYLPHPAGYTADDCPAIDDDEQTG